MRTHMKPYLPVFGLFILIGGCGDTDLQTSSAVDEQAFTSAQEESALTDESASEEGSSALSSESACWSGDYCRGYVLARGISLRACNRYDDASSWRSSYGKCLDL